MDRIHVTFQPMPIIRTQRVRNYFNMINSLNQIDNILDESLNQAVPDDNSVSEEFKNNLKEINVTEEMISREIDCSICLDKFKLNDKCIQLPCSDTPHYFHSNCESCPGILPWLEKNNTCPVCRTEFPKENNLGPTRHAEPEPENELQLPESLIATTNTDLSPGQRHGIGLDNNMIIENQNENQNETILNTNIEETIINTIDNYLRRMNQEINTMNDQMNINEEEIDNDLQRAIELSLLENND